MKKGLADVYETILDASEFIIHTWYTHITDENENHVYCANQYDAIQMSYTQNRLEYWQMQSISTSCALAMFCFCQEESCEIQDASHEIVVSFTF